MERCASRIVNREVKGKPWHFATHAGSLAVGIDTVAPAPQPAKIAAHWLRSRCLG